MTESSLLLWVKSQGSFEDFGHLTLNCPCPSLCWKSIICLQGILTWIRNRHETAIWFLTRTDFDDGTVFLSLVSVKNQTYYEVFQIFLWQELCKLHVWIESWVYQAISFWHSDFLKKLISLPEENCTTVVSKYRKLQSLH